MSKEQAEKKEEKKPLGIPCGSEKCKGFPKKGYRYRTVASKNKDDKKVVACRSCGTQKAVA